jgi:hypothetical protein
LILNRKCDGLSPWPMDKAGNRSIEDLGQGNGDLLIRARPMAAPGAGASPRSFLEQEGGKGESSWGSPEHGIHRIGGVVVRMTLGSSAHGA